MTMGTSERPIQILLVEDNPGDARLTQEALKNSEYAHHLNLAQDGEEAMEILRKEGEHADAPKPDLILLDLNLPRKDGREVLAEMKMDEELVKIPVVVLTTSNAQQDLLYSYGLGANSYIRKPVSLDQFNRTIKGMLDYWVNVSLLPAQ